MEQVRRVHKGTERERGDAELRDTAAPDAAGQQAEVLPQRPEKRHAPAVERVRYDVRGDPAHERELQRRGEAKKKIDRQAEKQEAEQRVGEGPVPDRPEEPEGRRPECPAHRTCQGVQEGILFAA